MPVLSIGTYDQAEAKAIIRACYPAIRAFRPAAFTMANFPTRISDERELVRYADIMCEIANRNHWYREVRYSAKEAELISQLASRIEELTAGMGHRIRPFMCLFPPIPVLRAVEALASGRKLRILEIGPGSGHLGAYLIRSGHAYIATDNAQALYLWQNRLFRSLAGAAFIESASGDRAEGPDFAKPQVVHVPWWDFAEWYRDPPSFDLVVCDAAMGEMDVLAANYIIRLAAEMLRRSTVGAFLFRHIGECRLNTLPYIESRFQSARFMRTEGDGVTLHCLSPLKLPEKLVPVGGGIELLTASSFLPIDSDKLLESYSFFDFIRFTDP